MIEILLTILLIFAGLLGALLLMLLVVLLSPVRLRLALQEGTFFLWAGLGPFRLRLLPPKPKRKRDIGGKKEGERPERPPRRPHQRSVRLPLKQNRRRNKARFALSQRRRKKGRFRKKGIQILGEASGFSHAKSWISTRSNSLCSN